MSANNSNYNNEHQQMDHQPSASSTQIAIDSSDDDDDAMMGGGDAVAVAIDCNCNLYDNDNGNCCNDNEDQYVSVRNQEDDDDSVEETLVGPAAAATVGDVGNMNETVTANESGGHNSTDDHQESTNNDDKNRANATVNNDTNTATGTRGISDLVHEMIAEMSGTFVIVQLGTAAIMSAIYTDGTGLTDLISIAIVWMIAVTIAICISASISGAHLNPAITLAFVLIRRTIRWSQVLPYIFAQFLGAILASVVNLYMYDDKIRQYELKNDIVRSSSNAIPTAKVFGEYFSTTVMRAFFVEAFGTFVLAAVVFALTHPKNDLIHNTKDSGSNGVFIPPLIGCTVGALISTLAPITQAGFNPARDFGPRFVAYFAGWKSVAFLPEYSWLVYMIGPIVGAILGAAYVDFILFRPKKQY